MTQPDAKILLVDDDEVDVRAVRRAFKKSGRREVLHVANNGFDALSALRGAPEDPALKGPLVILLDLNMPMMNGFEFLDALRADPDLKHHVVFVLSTSGEESDMRESYRRQAAGYLMKSEFGAKPEILTELLSSYLAAVHLPS